MADEKMDEESLKHVFRRTMHVAGEFKSNQKMGFDPMLDHVRSLLLENGRQKCPKLHEFLKYLNQLSGESLKNFFESVNILMTTTTKNVFGGNRSNSPNPFQVSWDNIRKYGKVTYYPRTYPTTTLLVSGDC